MKKVIQQSNINQRNMAFRRVSISNLKNSLTPSFLKVKKSLKHDEVTLSQKIRRINSTCSLHSQEAINDNRLSLALEEIESFERFILSLSVDENNNKS